MTKLRGLAPILETDDLEASVDYYESILGFECGGTWPEEGKPCWASMRRGDVVIMLSSRNPSTKVAAPTLTGSIYLYPESVDDAWEELKDKAEVSYEIETFEYGMKEFGILDCNGYLLQFGQGTEEL